MARNRFHEGPGPSQRQLRVGETIRRALAQVLQRGEVHDDALSRLSITVSEVQVSPDLKVATAFVMPLGGDRAEEALDALTQARSEIRRAVNKALALKFSPELRFRLDETFDRMDDTRRMFSEERVRRDVEHREEYGDEHGDKHGDDDPEG